MSAEDAAATERLILQEALRASLEDSAAPPPAAAAAVGRVPAAPAQAEAPAPAAAPAAAHGPPRAPRDPADVPAADVQRFVSMGFVREDCVRRFLACGCRTEAEAVQRLLNWVASESVKILGACE